MPSDPPQLFIIAGPNGAGKSTVSKSLLDAYDTEAFDWDKEFYQKIPNIRKVLSTGQ